MDRAVHAAATEQGVVRRVHDRIDAKRCDVGDEDVADGGADGEGEEGRGHARILSLPREAGEGGRAQRGRVGWALIREGPTRLLAAARSHPPRWAGRDKKAS